VAGFGDAEPRGVDDHHRRHDVNVALPSIIRDFELDLADAE
jgi:hypothetical protein